MGHDGGGVAFRSCVVSNLLFLRRSLAYRSAAVEMMRKARGRPFGPERRSALELARALKDLAKTEAWLEGQTPHRRPVTYRQDRAAPLAEPAPAGVVAPGRPACL
jgi:hypothetical protein